MKKHETEVSRELYKSIILSMISAGSKSLPNYINNVKPKVLIFLESAPFKVNCSNCLGHKYFNQKCRKFINVECHNCKGVGETSYVGLTGEIVRKSYLTCKKTKKCVDCRSCRKTGRKFNTAVLGECAASRALGL
jgi:hypothetical protein